MVSFPVRRNDAKPEENFVLSLGFESIRTGTGTWVQFSFTAARLPYVYSIAMAGRICLQWVGGTVQTISETDHVGCPPVWRMISLKCTSDAFIAPPLESLEKQPSAPAVRQQTARSRISMQTWGGRLAKRHAFAQCHGQCAHDARAEAGSAPSSTTNVKSPTAPFPSRPDSDRDVLGRYNMESLGWRDPILGRAGPALHARGQIYAVDPYYSVSRRNHSMGQPGPA